jgi:hypothetical protein
MAAVVVTLLTASCSKSDGQICIDNYMDMFDRANPDATSKHRAAFKRLIIVKCTDPG